MWSDLAHPLLLSLGIALTATICCILLGTPAAWLMARRRGMVVTIAEAITILPLALPPTVVGYALLIALGRSGIGPWLDAIGLPFIFSPRGAIVAATVIALPLYVLPARAAIAAVDRDAEESARLDGAGRVRGFVRVTLPLAWRGLLAATVLAFARSLGEFGATLMVAGRIPGRTETLPLAIYGAVESGHRAQALGPALILAAIALMATVVQRGWLERRGE